MPTKAKENENNKSTKRVTKASTTKNTTKRKTKIASKEKNTKKTSTAKKISIDSEATSVKKTSSVAKKTSGSKTNNVREKKASAAKKASVNKSKAKTSSTKRNSISKNKLDNTKTKTPARKKSSTSRKKLVASSIEYYDLPSRYNQTMVKVLFQTPKKLFVYWEISDEDRNNLIKQNGDNFFNSSTPFLVVKNETLNYSFEFEINDYANSWYFNVPDSNCKYSVELIRKFNNIPIQIKSSNDLEVPNNHILFEKNRHEIFFINVKNNYVTSKRMANLQFINHLGIARPLTLNAFYNKFYNEKDLYSPTNPSSY